VSTRPNVLFIISDQHNAKILGHRGHSTVRTANLDGLTAAGARFDNAIMQNFICRLSASATGPIGKDLSPML